MRTETRFRLTKKLFSRQKWLTLIIVGFIILPRIINLDAFRIVDEAHLWKWTEQFTRAILAGDWEGTAITAYPGLPFFWIQFFNLGFEMVRRTLVQGEWIGDAGMYLLFHEWGRETFLAQRRLLLGLVNGALVVWLYLLVRRLFGQRIGLVAAILLTLDPFLLSESRVARVEALSAEFVGLAVVVLLLYFRERLWRWLALSGVLGGLALATKSQNLLLVGFAGLAIAGYWLWHGRSEGWKRSLTQMVLAGTLWLAMMVLAFVLSWPAMWVAPRESLTLIVDYASTHAIDPGVLEIYFLGKTVVGRDPGPLFYVIVFLWRMTPWSLVGIIGALIWLVQKRRENTGPLWSRRLELFVLLAFVLLYGAGMSMGVHKRTRYLLPVFPVLDVAAAIGLVWLGQAIVRRWLANYSPRLVSGVGLGALLFIQSLVVLPHHPYYYTFYNPLLGGGPVAVQLIRVGWGEGMDQVAAYLNTKPEAENLLVATRFGKYMLGLKGKFIPLDSSSQWLQADYISFYIQQVQKMIDPSPGVIRYFQRQTPEHIVRLGGINYAWIYANPIQHPANPRLSSRPNKATLLGYSWQQTTADRQQVPADPLQVKVVWQNDGLIKGETIAVRLVNDARREASDWQLCQTAPGSETAAHTAGEVVESLCVLSAAEMQPGTGGLEFAVPAGKEHFTPFTFPLARTTLQIDEAGDIFPLTKAESHAAAVRRVVPDTATPLQMNYAYFVRLAAYEVQPEKLLPDDTLTVTLYWQAMQLMPLDLHESVKLLDATGVPAAQVDQAPPLPTSHWWPGEVISDTVIVPLEANVPPPAALWLDVGLTHMETLRSLPAFDATGQEIPRSVAYVKLLPVDAPDLQGVESLSYTFEKSLALVGMRAAETTVAPGETLSLQLYWSSLAPVDEDYTVFIHLIDDSETTVIQGDGPPANGYYPTSVWTPGEIIPDSHLISISNEARPGRYRLVVGLYRVSDGARLLATSSSGQSVEAIVLGEVKVR